MSKSFIFSLLYLPAGRNMPARDNNSEGQTVFLLCLSSLRDSYSVAVHGVIMADSGYFFVSVAVHGVIMADNGYFCKIRP